MLLKCLAGAFRICKQVGTLMIYKWRAKRDRMVVDIIIQSRNSCESVCIASQWYVMF